VIACLRAVEVDPQRVGGEGEIQNVVLHRYSCGWKPNDPFAFFDRESIIGDADNELSGIRDRLS